MQKTDKTVEYQRMPIGCIEFRTKRVERKVINRNIRSAFELYFYIVYTHHQNIKNEFSPMDILEIKQAISKFGENYVFTLEMINYLNENCIDRDINLYADWHAGMTYKSLGKKYDCTPDRAVQVVRSIDNKLIKLNATSPDSTYRLCLQTRAYNALSRGNIHTINQLIDAFEQGTLFKIRNFGVVSLIEIAEKLDNYKGTDYRELIRGREEELIYEGKTKCRNIPIHRVLKQNELKKINDLEIFKFYHLDDGKPDDDELSDVILVHKNMEEKQLYFLVIADFRTLDKPDSIILTTKSYGYPIYKIEGNYYSPVVNMVTISFDDYLSGSIKIIEYKLEGK